MLLARAGTVAEAAEGAEAADAAEDAPTPPEEAQVGRVVKWSMRVNSGVRKSGEAMDDMCLQMREDAATPDSPVWPSAATPGAPGAPRPSDLRSRVQLQSRARTPRLVQAVMSERRGLGGASVE